MRKISHSNQQLLDLSISYGLNLMLLRERYKLPFTIKLFKHLRNETRKKVKLIEPLFPDNVLTSKFSMSAYIDHLEESGIELKKSYGDFIDEDTGKYVRILRFKFKPIKPRAL